MYAGFTSFIAFFGFNTNASLIVIIATIFLVSAIQMIVLGILGEYLSKMYMETKNRPLYIVKETNVDEKNNWFI